MRLAARCIGLFLNLFRRPSIFVRTSSVPGFFLVSVYFVSLRHGVVTLISWFDLRYDSDLRVDFVLVLCPGCSLFYFIFREGHRSARPLREDFLPCLHGSCFSLNGPNI